MKRAIPLRRTLASLLLLALSCTFTLPSSAFFWSKKDDAPYVADFSKNGLVGAIIPFDSEDFAVQTNNKATLNSITIRTLPDPGAGILALGGQPLEVGAVVDRTALSGLRFQTLQNPTVMTTTFTFTPSFSSGQDCQDATVTIYLLTEENQAPVARNMALSTYQNIAITGYFDAADQESDLLSFQLTSTPARGAVTLAADGSSQFVYTPYENKTGSDTFTYVAVDSAGNTSAEAKITIRIEKPSTKVTYADLEGHSAHKAAIRLAEEGIYVGQYLDGNYFFHADTPVSRAQFLTMAMAAADLEPMEGVTLTGFSDDAAIPTWAKGAVSAALRAGAIQGSRDESGAPVFDADSTITRAEASVMLNKLLQVEDAPVEVFFSDSETHWAAQATVNLATSGVLREADCHSESLSEPMTLGEVAELLDGALNARAAIRTTQWFSW
jgi:hypothetical protein